MTSPIPLLHLSATIVEAANLILRYNATSLPVVDDPAHAGWARLRAADHAPDVVAAETAAQVGDIMHTTVISYNEDAPVDRIFDFLSRVSIGQVFVVRDGRPIGVITRGSLLRWLSNWLSRGDKTAAALSAGPLEHTRLHARQTANELARRAGELSDPLVDPEDDSVLALIEIMFKMQELMNDLLVCSPTPSATIGSLCQDVTEIREAMPREANHV